MSFVSVFNKLSTEKSPLLREFEALLKPMDNHALEQLAGQAHRTSLQYHGRAIRLFAPLYLSNECINNCSYCGFSRDNPVMRVTLSIDQIETEARHLVEQGFRNILLVAGEHPKWVSGDYLKNCVARLRPFVPALSLEVGPMETADYVPLVEAGTEGLVVYQETYDRLAYDRFHTLGPKKNFDWRLETPERAADAGFRRIGIGVLLGLSEWRAEALALAAHAEFLLKTHWKSQLTLSLPRMRPAAGGFHPDFPVSDRDFVQLICALRVTFPQVGLVLSTREEATLRDRLVPLGVTMMSAGSHTEPGGYTGAGKEQVHLTVRGKIMESQLEAGLDLKGTTTAEEQFEISDDRSPEQMAARLKELGYEAVWKDWDQAFSEASVEAAP
ncbi:MAG: 2-iminoacetate synthase ThiH [Verrucomicrobiota bacterium]|nr:2-iminoacetate synthase ThiH [Verrucomicrobiota bacterium]